MTAPDPQPIAAKLADTRPIPARLVEPPAASEVVPARLVHPADAGPKPPPRRVGLLRRGGRWIRASVTATFRMASLTVLLALITAVPALQLVTFGYLLEVVGRLSRGAALRDSLPWYRHATRLGMALLAIFLVSLPVHLLTHWSQVARLVDPQSGAASPLRAAGIAAAVLAMALLAWAWMRGGRLRDYLWPAPLRFLGEFWRPSTWIQAKQDLWKLFLSLEIPRLFWLGLRGFVGTMIWITIPAVLLIVANREGRGGGAGLLAVLAFLSMGVVLLYLPLLQANFAAENRLRAMFQWSAARDFFRHAPWSWTIAMLLVYALAIPLYLLKIETLPREATWVPCLLFVALMLPARVATGLAMRRARRLPPPRGFFRGLARWTARLLMPGIVGAYLLAVFLSQYLDVHGLATWFHQHAVLVPVPFTGT
ncbi:DUF4013 domain-containing protein [Roseimaritima sediminicola]|uniref:DUF4013 domain-containing protein n=1 Tax=Roseimaritima sediminicola TaxID=2662066 RepID=UPI001F1F7FB6|nr:DUF4013 domain-containing protein [Roseimaritima sediminicola]